MVNRDVTDTQRGVDWQMIEDARCKLKSVYPKILKFNADKPLGLGCFANRSKSRFRCRGVCDRHLHAADFGGQGGVVFRAG